MLRDKNLQAANGTSIKIESVKILTEELGFVFSQVKAFEFWAVLLYVCSTFH